MRRNTLCLVLLIGIGTSSPTLSADKMVDFNRDIRPILNDHCASCHGGVKKSGGLSVVSRELLLAPTDSLGRPAVVPGHSTESELVRRLTSDVEGERMPLDEEPLNPGQIEMISRWIDEGADWPTHWSFVPAAATQPGNDSAAVVRGSSAIDKEVFGELAKRGISPSPPADRVTLIRRLSLDLIGLLPTPAEVTKFVNDPSPDAYERLVDRLLGSPHFGERWGRHWLDEARYADSEGYESDLPKEDEFHYRDWVIRATNDDMPIDQFTIKQLAGDLLPERTNEDLIATKFHLQAQFNLEGGVDAEEDRTKRTIDCVNTVGTIWLGLTIGCCQCHDHPYDPLTSDDFYGLYAFFNNLEIGAGYLGDDVQENADKLSSRREERWKNVLQLLDGQVVDKNLNTETQRAMVRLRKYDNLMEFVRYAHERQIDRRTTYKFRRGDFLQPVKDAGEVQPHPPAVLPPMTCRESVPDRLDLAKWLVSPSHPLTARVTVNKVWMHLFGTPLVGRPDDFGSRGEQPTHPELLDSLANWFVHEAHWSRKALIREIVNSAAYKQSSAVRPELIDVDPDNKLLARQNRMRTEGEIVRDIALQTSGLLCDSLGGPSVFPPLPDIVAHQTFDGSFKFRPSIGEDRYRRGLYTFFRRTAIDPNLSTFDCPDASAARPMRARSNNALQALALLQNEVFHETAQAFAQRILHLDDVSQTERSNVATDEFRLTAAFRIALTRSPQPAEVATLTGLLDQGRSYYRNHPPEAQQLIGNYSSREVEACESAAWVATLRVLFNLDEFITRN